jgi:hypothetical protein
LAEEETKILRRVRCEFSLPDAIELVAQALRVVVCFSVIACFKRSVDPVSREAPDSVPLADRLRAALPVGTNRAPYSG